VLIMAAAGDKHMSYKTVEHIRTDASRRNRVHQICAKAANCLTFGLCCTASVNSLLFAVRGGNLVRCW
jgi:hypothetical protein